jgi:APA family basic amino acid/polyamine antiporter
MDPGVVAALAVGVSPYAVALWPSLAGLERVLAIGLVWLLALLGMAGLTPSTRVLNGLTLAKVLSLVAVAMAALTIGSGTWSHFSPFVARRPGAPPLGTALGLAVVSALYSFGGFWEASRMAGETRGAARNVPRALVLGVSAVTLLYLLTTLAFLYLVPIERASTSAEFARLAGDAAFGAAGRSVLSAVVILSAAASAGILILMAPRVDLAMARDGVLPATLARLSPRTRAPVRATSLLAAIATLLIASGTFPQILAFFMCPALGFVALSASALFVLRRREGKAAAFRAPGYPVVPIFFVGLLAAAVVLLAVARPVPALAGFGLVMAGLPVYRARSARGGLAGRAGGSP